MIALRADVADGQDSVGRKLALHAKRPGDQRGSLHIGLHATGDEFRAGRNRSGGINRKFRHRIIRQAVHGIERSVLIGTIAKSVLKVVVHAEPRTQNGLRS